jgi:hypothetical protein
MKAHIADTPVAIASIGEIAVPFVIKTDKRLLLVVERTIRLRRISSDDQRSIKEPDVMIPVTDISLLLTSKNKLLKGKKTTTKKKAAKVKSRPVKRNKTKA